MSELIKYKGFVIKVSPEEYAESPREWDNLATMVCFHKRYELGDKHDYRFDDYNSWSELARDIIRREKPVDIAPLYLYDHSGLRIKIGSFSGLLPQGHAEFDSGQVGFIFVPRAKAVKEFGKRVMKSKVRKIMQGEVQNYDDYISGNVWRYNIMYGDDIVGGLGGIFGSENVMKEARSEVDSIIAYERKKHAERLKGYIKGKVPLQYRKPYKYESNSRRRPRR